LAIVVLLTSCKKDDDPKFSSAEGDWTYTTPDGKISVDFSLGKNGTTWTATNAVMRVDGVTAEAVIQVNWLDPPNIEELRINANDSKVTYPYVMYFTMLVISDDFTEIKAPGATYTWPIDKTNYLTNVTITRR
jgi:hypothetical protein